MQYLKTSLLVTLSALFAVTTNAQTADEIINKYLDAIGGKDNLAQVTSIHLKTSVAVMGNDNPGETTILIGKAYRSESEFNGSKFIQVYNETSGWTVNPMAGGGAETMPDGQYNNGKDNRFIGGALYNYAINHVGKATLDGKDGNNYKITYTSPEGIATTFFIDAVAYLLTRMVSTAEMQGQQVEMNISLSDYK